MAARAQIVKQYNRILTQWPVDRLRPEISFQNVLKKRLEAAPTAQPANGPITPKARPQETDEVNALLSLLENRYSKQYQLSTSMMRPASTPDHYEALAKELEEAPNRTWFGNFVQRITHMVRMK